MGNYGTASFGPELRRQRMAAGLSLAGLARLLHYSKSYLSRIETGGKTPSRDLARRCDTALGAGGALASFVPPAPAPPGPRVPGPPPAALSGGRWFLSLGADGRGEFGALARREVLAAGTMSLLTWAVSAASTRCPDRPYEFGSFRLLFDEMRHLGQVMPPAAIIPMLITQTHALKLATRCAAAPARAELLVLAGRFAEYTGWMAQEAGDDAGALWWTREAVELAAAGGDDELAAYALVRRGLLAMYRHDAVETVAVARRAQTARCGDRVRGLAAVREAQGHALAGDHDSCRRALDRAAPLLQAASDDHRQPILGTSTMDDPVGMATGWCMYDLGRPRQAADLLRRVLTTVPDQAHRTRARIGARYALALVGAGEVQEGCVVGGRVLDAPSRTDSATVRKDLRRLAQQLNRWLTNRSVRDLMPRLAGALNGA